MTFLYANGSNEGGIYRFRNNHELFERLFGLPSNGNLDNIHTSAACSSTELSRPYTNAQFLFPSYLHVKLLAS